MQVIWTARIWVAIGLLLVAPVGYAQTDHDFAERYSIRVDPSISRQINGVLAQLAEDMEADIPPDQSTDTFLQQRCGVRSTPRMELKEQLPDGTRRIRHASCATFGGKRTVVVEPGLTLEAIAVRWGLRPDKAGTLRIESGPDNPLRTNISPIAMLPGDRVVLPQTSLWTDIQLKPGVTTDRDALISAFADALDCTENRQECVRKRGVLVLRQGRSVPSNQTQQTPDTHLNSDEVIPNDWYNGQAEGITAAVISDRIGNGSKFVSSERSIRERVIANMAEKDKQRLSSRTESSGMLVVPAHPTIEGIVSDLPMSVQTMREEIPAPREGQIVGVAADQWPYDVRRVAAVLLADKLRRQPVSVGIADGGLRVKSGEPLPKELLASNSDELDEEPQGKNSDDDLNSYLDDYYGAGVRRAEDVDLAPGMLGTGELSLCPSDPGFDGWSPESFELASHGSVVASIASGWPLWEYSTVELGLPRIRFYRMVTSQCDAANKFLINDSEIIKAIQYLFDKNSDVINLSLKSSIRGDNPNFRGSAASELTNDLRMLVVAAGNDDAENLDEGTICPACLGSPSEKYHDASRRVIVVGSAERTLTQTPTSNYGPSTVRFFAPGSGPAINILGNPAGNLESSTSYAAPIAALSVAILKSYNIQSYWDIKERLAAASWPLTHDDGSPHTGKVIDLTKVVGVYRDVVESIFLEDGEWIRRNYIGEIQGNIQDLIICEEKAFNRARFHSINLGLPRSDGARLASWTGKWNGQRYPFGNLICRSDGSLVIHDIIEGRIELPMDRVTHVLLSLR